MRGAYNFLISCRRKLRRLMVPAALAMAALPPSAPAQEATALPRFPTLHGENIVFEAHGNLWQVARTGGVAVRLTSEPGFELMPRYSPDGRWIAFTGQYQGNRDVYVIPAGGGAARRVTFHSDVTEDAPLRWGPDNMVVAWTPDSRNIVFLSRRQAWNSWFGKLFSVPLEGGLAQPLPLDRGGLLSYSPDGRRIAYNRIFRNFRTWKRYDGGLAQDIDLYDLQTHELTHLTDWPGTETAPMWHGERLYFLSDHDEHRRANLWCYDFKDKSFREVTHFTDYDVDFPSLGDNGIVFQQGGALYVLDLPGEQLHRLQVAVPDDGVHTGPRFVDARKFIRDVDSADQTDWDIAPSGKRMVLAARGDLFTVPVENGNTRNLTQSPGADDDHPAWSPDGSKIAYTTDASGEHQLAWRPAQGGKETVLTHFGEGFRYGPVWSPQGDRLAFSDNEHRLWIVGLGDSQPTQVAADRYNEMHDFSWSPDGQWLAYSITGENQLRAIHLYSLASGKSTALSDGRENDQLPAFDPDGKYLFFASSRRENTVLHENEFNVAELKSMGLFVATLAADAPSLFAPRSDEGEPEAPAKEGDEAQAKDGGKGAGKDAGPARAKGAGKEASAGEHGKPPVVHIDLEGLMRRAVSVPVAPADIVTLEVRHERIYYHTSPLALIEGKLPGERAQLRVYDWKERKDGLVLEDFDRFRLTPNGEKVIFKKEKDWFVADAKPAGEGAPHAERKPLNLSHLRLRVEPRQEWAEMFDNAWRLERDFFFSRKMNGVDWEGVRASYRKLLPLAGSREDVNYLIGEMLGELGNSHTYVGGGDEDDPTEHVRTAFLGADLAPDPASGRYVFARIFAGDNSREAYRSPLVQPGIAVHAGDFLLAIDGQELKLPMDPDTLLVGKEGATVRLSVADSAKGTPREVVVEPAHNELRLREQEWIDHNRQAVERLSGGRVGYVYLSDMEQLGMEQFMRQFYNQLDKEALVVDDRWNGGGFIDQIVLERLRRMLVGMGTSRQRVAVTDPQQVLVGPKACLINEYSASDGDLFPHFFRKYGLGPLIGMRTWGGVRGIRGYWPLLDGGYITVPEDSIYGLDSQWVLENRGVVPDIRVEDKPAEWLEGRDVQLQAAVDYLLGELAKRGKPRLPPPPELLPPYAPPGHE